MSNVTMALCPHDLTDREVAVQCDGYCPLCMIYELAALRAKLVAAREWMRHGWQCSGAGMPSLCSCGLQAFLEGL